MDYAWQLITDTCAHLALGWSEGEIGRQAAQNLRENISPAVMRGALDAVRDVDVSAMLPNIKAPTLVFSRPKISWIPTEAARTLASRIPDAQLSVLDGESTAPYLGDTETVIATLQQFLDSDTRTSDEAQAVRIPPETDTMENAASREDQYVAIQSELTDREKQVIILIASGRTNSEIAEELALSIRTVKRHLGNIYTKIGARGRADATVFALTRGLV